MKLSDLTTDRAADVLCEVSIYLVNITTDEELMGELKKRLQLTGHETTFETVAIAAEKMKKIAPIVLKKHKADIFGILAAVNGDTPEKVAKQNIIKTMSQIKELVKDEELISFFKSCVSPETE